MGDTLPGNSLLMLGAGGLHYPLLTSLLLLCFFFFFRVDGRYWTLHREQAKEKGAFKQSLRSSIWRTLRYHAGTARRISAEHLIATKALRCTAAAWILTVAESFAKF